MKLEIVSHCWNYSRLLTYQLSSLVINAFKTVDLTMTVYYSGEDSRTCGVLDYFGNIRLPRVDWRWQKIDSRSLMRRAIGRNRAALETEADWIWFADADMCFLDGSLDSFAEKNEQTLCDLAVPLVFPETVYINECHDTGDKAIRAASGQPRILSVTRNDFVPETYPRAIGGVQICRGELMRRIGYCRDNLRFMRPTGKWRVTYEDRHFRKLLGTPGVPITMDNVYRIRHSKCGRDHEGLQL